LKKIIDFHLVKKAVAVSIFVLALSLQCNNASANFTTQLNETFQSGATFSGILTFDDGIANLLAVNGTLSGGT
jgi:hypothetical protein